MVDQMTFIARSRSKLYVSHTSGIPSSTNTHLTSHAIRVFGTPPDKVTLPAFRRGPPQTDNPTIQIWTDGSTTDYGTKGQKVGFGIWSETLGLSIASRLTSEPVTNNRAELAAATLAIERAPRNADITIMTDSQYVVTGMTTTAQSWEDQGWLGVANADLWRKALYLIRSRTAVTRIAKVRAHTGIAGNEEADRLAKAGADGETEEQLCLEVPPSWQLQGAKMTSITYRSTYEWIRKKEAKPRETRAAWNLDRIQDCLLEDHEIRATEADIWRGLRKPYIRREISDFLWLMIHGRSQCGTMFSNWGPGWEELQYCSCGAVETMEHLLVGCDDAIWRIRLWRETAALLRSSGLVPEHMCRPPTFPEIMAVGSIRLKSAAATRLWATIISETAFTVWKLRNRSRFDEIRISTRMAKDLWRTSLEKRARSDLAAARLKGPTTASRTKTAREAVTAWRSVISIKGDVTVWSPSDYG